jgi:hypothetical protein
LATSIIPLKVLFMPTNETWVFEGEPVAADITRFENHFTHFCRFMARVEWSCVVRSFVFVRLMLLVHLRIGRCGLRLECCLSIPILFIFFGTSFVLFPTRSSLFLVVKTSLLSIWFVVPKKIWADSHRQTQSHQLLPSICVP